MPSTSSQPAFGDLGSAAHFNIYGYNDRSELEAGREYAGDTIQDLLQNENPARRRLYAYDPIGNRQNSTESTTVRHYCANNLNQYTFTRNTDDSCPTPTSPVDTLDYDDDGNLTSDDKYAYTWDAENRGRQGG